VLREHGTGERFDLTLGDDSHAGTLEPEVDAADARE